MDESELKIGKRIASGRFADCYLGTYRGSEMAIKICNYPIIQQLTEYYKDNWISVLKSLNHENILHFVGIIEQTSTKPMRIISQYIQGGSLERFRKHFIQLAYADKLRISCFCWRGLQYLHSENICHGDIKPSNILISTDLKTVKIADCGLADLKDRMSTDSGNKVEDTYLYLAPELANELLATSQSASSRTNSKAGDVYSMGATICELFSGQTFWTTVRKGLTEQNEEVLQILFKQLYDLEHRTEPIKPTCWKFISCYMQEILIHAIIVDFTKRKSALEFLTIFTKQTNLH